MAQNYSDLEVYQSFFNDLGFNCRDLAMCTEESWGPEAPTTSFLIGTTSKNISVASPNNCIHFSCRLMVQPLLYPRRNTEGHG
jgi:hypothetical protein